MVGQAILKQWDTHDLDLSSVLLKHVQHMVLYELVTLVSLLHLEFFNHAYGDASKVW